MAEHRDAVSAPNAARLELERDTLRAREELAEAELLDDALLDARPRDEAAPVVLRGLAKDVAQRVGRHGHCSGVQTV